MKLVLKKKLPFKAHTFFRNYQVARSFQGLCREIQVGLIGNILGLLVVLKVLQQIKPILTMNDFDIQHVWKILF